MKQDYFIQKRSHEGSMGSVEFRNWKNYRSAVVGSLSRLEQTYNQHGLCNHELQVIKGACSDIKQLKETLTQGSVPFSAIYSLSSFLRGLDGIGLVHTYRVDRQDPNGNKLQASNWQVAHHRNLRLVQPVRDPEPPTD